MDRSFDERRATLTAVKRDRRNPNIGSAYIRDSNGTEISGGYHPPSSKGVGCPRNVRKLGTSFGSPQDVRPPLGDVCKEDRSVFLIIFTASGHSCVVRVNSALSPRKERRKSGVYVTTKRRRDTYIYRADERIFLKLRNRAVVPRS
ncbi:hypothetical protein P5V15_005700 [Pogonomyrmex californicus]